MFALRLNFIDRFESWIETFLRKRFLCVAQINIINQQNGNSISGRITIKRFMIAHGNDEKWCGLIWGNFWLSLTAVHLSKIATIIHPTTTNEKSRFPRSRERFNSLHNFVLWPFACKSSKKEQLFEENKLFYYAWAAASCGSLERNLLCLFAFRPRKRIKSGSVRRWFNCSAIAAESHSLKCTLCVCLLAQQEF